MALLGVPIEVAAKLSGHERFDVFCSYARFIHDAPVMKYAIRVGSKTLYSTDTYDLREQFYREVKKLKRKQ